ncbi:glutamate racemase [Kangiella sediminilitoris]|uniref:Glutamate racemase n=1 Tax=Kangiella sediminilitoris TaxID=1144748 RepID=A0A1B3B7T3_9GAMM|nr:glutamate racemase [Kangiella sediminilitoris]AOE48855.1 glutamate racemase [Kangiella sediminilitoris]
MNRNPIGIFDSGVGGLSIYQSIRKHLPKENCAYFADSAFAPYGKLPKEELHKRCQHIADFFIERNVKAMVIACNTATAIMADWLRTEYDLPIVALEPAIKPAASLTRTGHIGVFATENTLHSQRYQRLVVEYARDKSIHQVACHGFVEQVEKGELDSPETIELIKQYLNPLLNYKVDTLVLGCTHYPFLAPSIKKVAGNSPLKLLDTADAVSLQLTRVLAQHEIFNESPHQQDLFFTSASEDKAQIIFSKLLKRPVKVQKG